MLFCNHCGTPLAEGARFCSKCGHAIQNNAAQSDDSTWGFSLLGFFLPIVGLVLYLVWHDTLPKRAKASGIGAIIGACIPIILFILLISLSFFILSMA